jgi:hypothetical protein
MGRFLRLSNGVARSFDESGSYTIYDNEVTFVSNLTTGSPYTLPGGGSYSGAELQIYLQGQRLSPSTDYTYPGGSPPFTTISFTFDIVIGDKLRFYIDRSL